MCTDCAVLAWYAVVLVVLLVYVRLCVHVYHVGAALPALEWTCLHQYVQHTVIIQCWRTLLPLHYFNFLTLSYSTLTIASINGNGQRSIGNYHI